MQMNNLIAVDGNTEGILGKFMYYSLANILIDKVTFQQIGIDFGFSKVKPNRESASDAFRNATSNIYQRITVKDINNKMQIYRIYCRDNKREEAGRICRELIKETLGASTNNYKKLANIYLDKETETVGYENIDHDYDVDVYDLCRQAVDSFDLYRVCYTGSHVDTVIESLLSQMEATKISVHGKLFFIPKKHIPLVDTLEDFISEINIHNKSGIISNRKRQYDNDIIANSMYVVDDEKQRTKMMQEFYASYKKDIEFYQERIQHFIDTGATSDTVINRWILKIDALQQKKSTYENVLKQELNDLNDEFSMLQLQSQELKYRTKSFHIDYAA